MFKIKLMINLMSSKIAWIKGYKMIIYYDYTVPYDNFCLST